MLLLLAQNSGLDTAMATAEVAESMNLFTMVRYGGWIMLILAVLLFWAGLIFFERLHVIRAAMKEDKSFMDRIKDYMNEGKMSTAINLCKMNDTPAARMIAKGLSRVGRPMQDVQVAIENAGNLEVANLEKGLVIMATIAGGAPMLGFLGTVLGMVQTFYNMAQTSGGVIEITALSEGMYQAMVTTIGGLIVGILVMFAYNFLVSRIDRIVRLIESRTIEFMDILNEPS